MPGRLPRTLTLVSILCVSPGQSVLGQDSEIRNWTAPPYWQPPPGGHATGDRATPDALAPSGRTVQGRQALAGGPTALPFISLIPCRLVDTRAPVFPAPLGGGFLPPATVRSYTLTGVCGVPAGAQAISLNVTVVKPTGPGFITLYPEGGAFPPVSTLNYLGNDVIVNAAVVPLSATGGISMALGVSGGDVILDTNGYYAQTPAVTGLNTLTGDVTLAAGTNVTITPSGNTLTVASTGGSGGPPTGAAGGSLSGTYPNPGIAAGAVGTSQLAAGAVTDAKVASGISYAKLTGVPGFVLKAGDSMSGSLALSAGDLVLGVEPSSGSGGSIVKGGQLFLHDAGFLNTFAGLTAGNLAVSGSSNAAFGARALQFVTSGSFNTAVGAFALASDDAGSKNTAVGQGSLSANVAGSQNTAIGYVTMTQNTTGMDGTAVGWGSLASNTTSSRNTAIGALALTSHAFDGGVTWMSENTAVGYRSLETNNPTTMSNGIQNTAVGAWSLDGNTVGFFDTAVGYRAGARSGAGTGYTGSAITYVANTTGNYNTFVGHGTGATADVSNCTAVGIDAYCDGNDQVRLGNYWVGSIGGKVGWSALSDARAKEDIHDLEGGLGLVLALRPVAYRLKGGNGRTDMGFLAQDVEALLGEGFGVLTVGGDPDRTLSLRYQDFVAPLVKAVQEQQLEIERDREEIRDLTQRLARLEALLTVRVP